MLTFRERQLTNIFIIYFPIHWGVVPTLCRFSVTKTLPAAAGKVNHPETLQNGSQTESNCKTSRVGWRFYPRHPQKIQEFRNIHPWKLTWHWKMPMFNRKHLSSNGGFSIVMLVFRECKLLVFSGLGYVPFGVCWRILRNVKSMVKWALYKYVENSWITGMKKKCA